MESETRRKIADTVTNILKNSNIEETTEFTIRLAASERLGIDLSDSEHRQFVRSVVESYLLAIAEEEDGKDKESEPSAPEVTREAVQEEQEVKPTKEVTEDSDRVICHGNSILGPLFCPAPAKAYILMLMLRNSYLLLRCYCPWPSAMALGNATDMAHCSTHHMIVGGSFNPEL
ncbi:RNA polymerase II transcriptional coactivator KELP [Senna tora]|uniref:RNA polymerase II transcriptional coactivator KELP n=1 Tax=Senna tora TaxID=362788 RepID=A0A834XF45_9FABA|nr:RNA polymerase II transcriptional coactivator KELP [Senna tora]